MRITEVNIPLESASEVGLNEVQMKSLGQLILLAGKNGAGKSRLLKLIEDKLLNKPTLEEISEAKKDAGLLRDEIRDLMVELKRWKNQLENKNDQTTTTDLRHFEQQLQRTNNDIKRHQEETERLERITQSNYLSVVPESNMYLPIRFVPKNLSLKDSDECARNEVLENAESIQKLGLDELPNGTLAAVQVMQDSWFDSSNPKSTLEEEQKERVIKDYERLNSYVEIFLGEKLKRNEFRQATIFGFPLGKAQLSEGQIVLLQLCLAIHAQEQNLKDMVLLMDEPENHLHPSILIEVLDKILSCVPDGQVWIATHSIPILAHFQTSQIWFVEDNEVGFAGQIPEKVLRSLLGDEEEIGKLQDFIGLPAQLASNRYAFESLFEPKVVETKFSDPQSIQIKDELKSISKSGKIRVLDFGAGKGRIISNLTELDEAAKEKVLEQLDYTAYDPSDKDKSRCEEAIIKAFGSSEKRYYNSLDDILANHDKNSFHVVIMCNVLHEIDPNKWLELFAPDGVMSKLISENGTLLVVEDHQIPTGEKAYQKGFLVLDTSQLKDLFKITVTDTGFTVSDARKDGRLKAHRIPASCLIRIDANSRIEALKSVSSSAKTKITEIRNQEQNYKNGKLHGFYVQQFANAQLCLSELTT